jgi:hypothetical protein
VTGEVIAGREVPNPEDSSFFSGIRYSVRVAKTFKGSVPKVVEVWSENSSGRFPIEIGETYLLFLYDAQGQLCADNCGNSGRLSETHDALSAVQTIVDKASKH